MTTTWIKIGIDEISGTGRRGVIQATRAELEAVFGSASHENADGSDTESDVSLEWDLKFSDGTVATIYMLGQDLWYTPAADEVVNWHVGGTSGSNPVRLIEAALKN